jgi:hypothetical protein
MIAVRATVEAPCRGTVLLVRSALFLAAIRYLRVGNVVTIMTMFGIKRLIGEFMSNIVPQMSALKP